MIYRKQHTRNTQHTYTILKTKCYKIGIKQKPIFGCVKDMWWLLSSVWYYTEGPIKNVHS